MLIALAGVSVPVRDKDAMELFAQAWSAVTIRSLDKWPIGALFNILVGMVQLGISLGVLEWFRVWLRAAGGREEIVAEYNLRDLLLACRDSAAELAMEPFHWDASTETAKRVLVLMRRLRGVHALCLNDDRIICLWLEQAKEVGGFRRYQVDRVAQYLCELGAEEAVQEWERHNAK